MPITAVTFDFWNTIAQVPPGAMRTARRSAVSRACEACDVVLESELLDAALEDVRLEWERSWAAGAHLHPSEGAQRFVGTLGLSGAAREAAAEAFLGALGEVPLELSPGIGACLEALRERDVALGIVCDAGFSGGELLRTLLDREGLLRHFEGWAFSDEVGHYKPSPRIFEAALEALGAAAPDSLHVGDLRRTDVAGAAALGMRTVRYRGMHDDPDRELGIEAEIVIDSHLDLPAIVDRADA
jgi:putative hydrolase of the HAD superfamily